MQKPNKNSHKATANTPQYNSPGNITETFQAPENETWLDSADIKIIFKISESTLYRMRKNKEIPFTKLQGKYLYPKTFFYSTLMSRMQNKP